MKTEQEKDHARKQAKLQLASIVEMLAAVHKAKTDKDRESAEQTILEDPLSVQFRGGWHSMGESGKDEEYKILLCTGGPAVRITGDIDVYGDAYSCELQYQDWGTTWTCYCLKDVEEKALLQYAQFFVFDR
jgi:hypothetical protein